LALQEQRLAEAVAARELASQRVETLEGRVSELEARLTRVQGNLRSQLVGLYRLGRAVYLRLLISLTSKEQLLPAIRQLRFLARRDSAALDRFLEIRASLVLEQEALDLERRRVELWIGQEEERRQQLARLQRQQAQQLARVERESRRLQSRADWLADKERKLANFLDFLYGREGAPLAGTPIQRFRGVLDWPVEGEVAVDFGPRLDPRYGTRVPHNGIGIRTAPGSQVRSVFPGRVLFAAPFQGFGLTVVVHHPGRVFTLYAGLTELRVGRQDVLSLGQVIGGAGDQVYFEIRVENRPENPRQWLR
jgi:septal ring factor EnvC (AmiA/AmiB activator)